MLRRNSARERYNETSFLPEVLYMNHRAFASPSPSPHPLNLSLAPFSLLHDARTALARRCFTISWTFAAANAIAITNTGRLFRDHDLQDLRFAHWRPARRTIATQTCSRSPNIPPPRRNYSRFTRLARSPLNRLVPMHMRLLSFMTSQWGSDRLDDFHAVSVEFCTLRKAYTVDAMRNIACPVLLLQ
ncbi:hypothetical protein FB451DRAFT_1556940 [Mycena latifolia]|nr:hypothetical protein FB451DRAFT_1556940 [Mycena latifolia]